MLDAGEQTTDPDEPTPERLRLLYQLEEAASAAAATGTMYPADDLVSTYERLREQARQVHRATGRSAAEFDRAVPPWTENRAVWAARIGTLSGSSGPRDLLERSGRARHLLRQLEAWVKANIRADEFERRQQIEAEARATQAAEARAAEAEARAAAAEAEAAEAQARASAAEAQTMTRRQIDRRMVTGLFLILAGIAVAVVLPVAVVTGRLGVAAAIVGGISAILLGIRVVTGPKLGGELVLWGSLIVAMIAVAVAVTQASTTKSVNSSKTHSGQVTK